MICPYLLRYNSLVLFAEEVIKRRLVIDGDGTGDERRLNALHKSLNKLCQSQDSPEETRDCLDRMLVQLSQCEFSVKKSRKVAAMNAIELENYKNLSRKITLDIAEEKKKIEKTKLELIDAKRIRKNKMEYDVLGKVIARQPDRRHSEAQLKNLQTELSALRASRTDAVRRLASRRRQFHGLVLLLHQLQTTVDEDDVLPATERADTTDDDHVMEIDVSADEVIVV